MLGKQSTNEIHPQLKDGILTKYSLYHIGHNLFLTLMLTGKCYSVWIIPIAQDIVHYPDCGAGEVAQCTRVFVVQVAHTCRKHS